MSRHLGDRRSGWGPGGCLPFWGPEMQGGRARRLGDGLPGMAFWVACLAASGGLPAGGWAAAICGGNSSVFNQLLTTFIVVAMVWRLAVFFLCSYQQFRRLRRLFRSPGAWAAVGGLRGGLGLLAVGFGNGRGSGKRDGASQDGGRVLPHILLTSPRTLGVAENRPGVFLQSGSEII